MALEDLADWIAEFSRPGNVLFAKRLSGNDTLATNAHQAGPYIPKAFLFSVFPELNRPNAQNPDVFIDAYIDSHRDTRELRAIWYNNKIWKPGGSRDETRVTRFGGRSSPLLDPDSTGALAVFVFGLPGTDAHGTCRIWVCDSEIEAEIFEDRLGPVEPGQFLVWPPAGLSSANEEHPLVDRPCWLEPSQILPLWHTKFPSGAELVERVLELRPLDGFPPDVRLMQRRNCEYELFRSIEQAVETPRTRKGFDSLDDMLGIAQSILQRRKSRAGRSLELQFRAILTEDGFIENEHYTYQAKIEGGKSPDFLFPNRNAYLNMDFPAGRLRMLGVKTTLRDRWRQVLNEADRIETKHLLTVQEGVSVGQFAEMRDAGIRLIVPESLRTCYPQEVRHELQSLESFIADMRVLH